jgi:hypothetical protein
MIDQTGKSLREGMTVRLLRAPDELLFELPKVDQQAIKSAIRQDLLIVGSDDFGNIELEFDDNAGTTHCILSNRPIAKA